MVSAYAPATVANVAVGFDILGFSIPILGDIVSVEKINKGVKIIEITGVAEIPSNPINNTAGYALIKMIEDEHLNFGFALRIKKGIPLGSGLGGSSASAVAAVIAANELLDNKLPMDKLFIYALYGESVASGSIHGDNIAPCLYGGLTICFNTASDIESFRVINIPIPKVYCLIIHPDIVIKTKDARKLIKENVSLRDHTDQSMRLAVFISACYTNNLSLLGEILDDRIIEAQRSKLIPDFDVIKNMVMKNGALGFSISGAGPSIFAWGSKSILKSIEVKVKELELPYKINTWISKIDDKGAYLI